MNTGLKSMPTIKRPELIVVSDKEIDKAFDWAAQTQLNMGWRFIKTVKLDFSSGDFYYDDNGNCEVCLFVDRKTGEAKLLRQWYYEGTMEFNRIKAENLEEIQIKAPRSYDNMVLNGLRLYNRQKNRVDPCWLF